MSPVGPLPDTFATPRLIAERLRPEHSSAVHAMHRDPALMAHLGGVRDEVFTRAYMDRNLQHWDRFGFGPWMVREIGSLEPIGRALLRHFPIDGVDDVEVGYAYYPASWGKGYATEMARACVELAYEKLHIDTIMAITMAENAASCHVLEKCGLAYERPIEHDGRMWSLYRGRRT